MLERVSAPILMLFGIGTYEIRIYIMSYTPKLMAIQISSVIS